MTVATLFTALAAAIAAMILGGLWYSPVLFGNTWRRLVDLQAEPDPKLAYGGALALMLLGALVFGAFIGPEPSLAFALGAGASAGVAWAASGADQRQLPHRAVHRFWSGFRSDLGDPVL